MWILMGFNKDTGKNWYKLHVNEYEGEKDENGKRKIKCSAETFINEQTYLALKGAGIKVYEKTITEVK